MNYRPATFCHGSESCCTPGRSIAFRSARASCISSRIRVAYSSRCRPDCVSCARRPSRSKRRQPSSSSKDLMAWLTADCVRKSSRAVCEKLQQRARVTKASSLRLSRIGLLRISECSTGHSYSRSRASRCLLAKIAQWKDGGAIIPTVSQIGRPAVPDSMPYSLLACNGDRRAPSRLGRSAWWPTRCHTRGQRCDAPAAECPPG